MVCRYSLDNFDRLAVFDDTDENETPYIAFGYPILANGVLYVLASQVERHHENSTEAMAFVENEAHGADLIAPGS